ncbi:MAG: hypothetical protein ACE5G8_16440, partial [Anaerolineae bacterium]
GGSLLLFVAGVLLFTGPEKPPPGLARRLTSPPAVALLCILLLAFGLRLWQFNSLPFGVWYDEAEAGLQARRWLADPFYKPPFYAPINVSGQFLLLYSLALRTISDTVQGLRVVSVLFGVAGAAAAYLFGRRLNGPLFGLSLAFFLAVMRWDINFSRIAMTGIDAPFFEFISLYYLLKLRQEGRLRDAAFVGLGLGLGLSFYTAFRLFALTAALFAVGWGAARLWRRRGTGRAWWGRVAAAGGMLLLGVWVALMPVAQHALRRPDSYWSRVRTTSIVTRRDDPNLARALRNSLGKHLAMFHLAGDKNGRHNLPGAPMLDPAMGVLMVLGIGLALKNIKKPAPLFFLLLFPAALSGGVFSLDFEAPQSLRTIAVLPAVAYFCALPVQALAAEARTAFRPWPARPLWLVAALAGVYILRLNAGMYFGPQAHDFSAWNAFSTPETITGRRMAQLGPGYDFYLSPFLLNHPTVRFLSPDTPRHNTLTLPDALPVRSDATRPVALFIHPDDGRLLAEAKRLYPAGRFETVSDQPSDPPAVHIATLSAADVASVQGLWLNYWAGSAPRPDQVPARALRAAAVDVDWSDALPLAPPFIAEWEGILYAEWYGLYRLQLSAPAEATLELDGREVLSGSGEQSAEVELAQGDHILRLRATSGA